MRGTQEYVLRGSADSPCTEASGRRVVTHLSCVAGQPLKSGTGSDRQSPCHWGSLKLPYSLLRVWSSIHKNTLEFHNVPLINNIISV